jgi:hypothetical protein
LILGGVWGKPQSGNTGKEDQDLWSMVLAGGHDKAER